MNLRRMLEYAIIDHRVDSLYRNEPEASVPASEPPSPPTLQAKSQPEPAVPPLAMLLL